MDGIYGYTAKYFESLHTMGDHYPDPVQEIDDDIGSAAGEENGGRQNDRITGENISGGTGAGEVL